MKTRLLANEKFKAMYDEIYAKIEEIALNSDFSENFFNEWTNAFYKYNSSKELVLRVNNIIKRVYKDKESNILTYDDYNINQEKRSVEYNKKEIKLTTLEFDLLLLFVQNKGKCFSREEILAGVWKEDYFGNDRAVDDLVRRVRKKLPKLKIEAVYGYGYRLL